ncbi:MAG: hypothetical protein K8E66_08940, partial [Phycisphaerales bacterium]|nr:hypothetical protein [Phycisphaerales bacterium]
MNGALARSTRPFDAVVSPYHLTTREPAAMVSLQLAERAVTLLLAPIAERAGVAVAYDTVRREAERSPAYRRFMRSWEWAQALFREDVIGSVHAGEDPVDDVRAACARLASDEMLAPLRRYAHPDLFADDRAYLNAASADVVKAGPDPGVSIPVAVGLDGFAADPGLVVARSAPASLAQKAESRLGRRVFRFSVPAVIQGTADRLLLVRALLADERACLARAITAAFEGGTDDGIGIAARRYAEAFERERDEITSLPGRHEQDEVRVVVGEVSLVGTLMPADAVL